MSVGPDAVFVVDDQYAPMAPTIKAAIAQLTDQPIDFVFNTHWHTDHTGGKVSPPLMSNIMRLDKMQRLAQSKRFTVEHEYETVFLLTSDHRKIVIGDFYGDPEIGIVDKNEEWCAVGGCGVILYWLKEPFAEYKYESPSPQYAEFYREEPNIWWVKGLKQSGPFELEVLLEDGTTHNISFQLTR